MKSVSMPQTWWAHKIYTSRREQWRDIGIGFVGCWALNVFLWIALSNVSTWLAGIASSSDASLLELIKGPMNVLPWVINLSGLTYFGLTRSRIAVGALAAIALGVVLFVCLIGLFYWAMNPSGL